MTDDTTLVIFGATGDLTSRLLLPALAQLLQHEPERSMHLIGTARSEVSEASWRAQVRKAFGDDRSDAASAVARSTVFRRADPTKAADLKRLLGEIEGRPVLYFAVPPQAAQQACEQLVPGDLPEGTVLALEKPFGSDEAGAHRLNEALRRLVPENRIFRVDHFLGRSTVLNVLGIRFANRLFEPVWSAEHVESVVIRFDESLGLEDRAGYYDRAGALVDMIQSHLLQVMAVVAMEPPASLDEADLRAATTAVLRATAIWDDNAVRSSRRARYTAGEAGGVQLPAYTAEPGVEPERQTETLAETTFEVRTARWAGVPFTLRSGKAIASPNAEIVLTFRPVRHLPAGFSGDAPGSVLRFSLGPDEMSLTLNVNGGEDPFALQRETIQATLGEGALRAYAEVLSGILDGDAALAVRGDAAELCWRIVQPVRDAWRRGDVPLEEYAAGSEGPGTWPALP
ncbi:glucose-6-phosphate dehydrogenase [Microbacterium sp. 18062]|uniref:glucose-6-phosphate dehydrogenase n=1 Tax=Microbacterium sp. 18062 TaxID=2681410 RepID=UPI00135C004A|nr:glucose-6-phosphate dehydrogenase [Microbacterium sp. 18062]